MITVAGCGGGGDGGSTAPTATQVVRGGGYVFSAPADWKLVQTPQQATLSPTPGADALVSVATFGLAHRFRSALWPRAERELDQVANRLAQQLGGTVGSRRTVRTGVREYTLSYERSGKKLDQRIRFVLLGRREYELLCRWNEADGEPPACGTLLGSFRPS